MTITTAGNRASYSGNGVTTVFPFPYRFLAAEDLIVLKINTVPVLIDEDDPDLGYVDPVSILVMGSDYNVSGVGASGGGSVTLLVALPSLYNLVIYGDPLIKQLLDLIEFENMPAEEVEKALDRLTLITARLKDQALRSIKLPDGYVGSFDPTLPLTPIPGAVVMVNDDGNGFKYGLQEEGSTGSLVPVGGDEGAVLVKNSNTDGDTTWDNLIISGYSARFNMAWSSVGLRDFINQILDITYLGPIIAAFVGSSNTLREKGTSVSSVTLTVTVTKRSNNIARIRFLQGATLIQDDNPPSNVGSGNTAAVYSTPFSDNITFTVEVTDAAVDGGPTMVTSNVTYSFVYPYYYGNGAPARTASQVAAMSKAVVTSNANYNRPFTTNNGDVYYFAYPASYGSLVSILDENGFETFSDWTKRTENITGLDGNAVSYFIYEFDNTVVAGSTNFTFKR